LIAIAEPIHFAIRPAGRPHDRNPGPRTADPRYRVFTRKSPRPAVLLLGDSRREILIHRAGNGIQPIPIMRYRLEDDSVAVAPDSHLIAVEEEFLGNPDGLRSAGPEDFRDLHGDVSMISSKRM
jgi:hypothetical protein